MKRVINTLVLMLTLTFSLSAQEARVMQKPVTVEMTENVLSTAQATSAIVIGNWNEKATVKTHTQGIGLQAGEGWISLSPPLIGETLNDVHTFNDNTAIVIGSGGAVYKTMDRGATWAKMPSGTTKSLRAIFLVGDKGWIVGDDRTILRTEDGGDSWSALQTDLPSYTTLYDVHFTDASTGWVITDSKIYKTTDGGNMWVEKFAEPDVTYWFESISFATSTTGVAVGTWGRTYRTTDGGETWQKIEAGSASWMYDIQFYDATHGCTAGLRASRISITVGGGLFGDEVTIDIDNPQYTLWETADGGASWTQRNFAYSGRLYGVQFLNATTGWTVGTNGAVFRTEDGGATWGVTQSVHDMYAVHFHNAQSGWAVGKDGTIIQSSNGGRVDITVW